MRFSRGRTPNSLHLVACLLLLSNTTTAATLVRLESRGNDGLQRRIEYPDEHVVLADCIDSHGVQSSQMAYFQSKIDDALPQKDPDAAIVNTPPGQAANWANNQVAATFDSSGVTFTAKLSPSVKDGEFAGTGDNGYKTPFTCWQKHIDNVYTTSNRVTCAQIYDCTHDPAPSALPNAVPSTTSPSISATSASATKSATATAAAQTAGSGLSEGALIGIIAGVVGTISAAAIAGSIYWLCTRRRAKRDTTGHGVRTGCCGLLGRRRLPPAELHATSLAVAETPQLHRWESKKELGDAGHIHELDGQKFRIEMATDHDRHEMDGQGGVGAEARMGQQQLSQQEYGQTPRPAGGHPQQWPYDGQSPYGVPSPYGVQSPYEIESPIVPETLAQYHRIGHI
ncbi:hypothetical protein B0H63DRAFT_471769 [Podospora didyma]|uniref:Uncharacterized protein n=1 Tax=Podospora didyma TaxID=330526 RepID=A0AAE0NNL8_9PEZI|nr:hypothetical protein B0H63DRAFT_471769 [Podospora didyma]